MTDSMRTRVRYPDGTPITVVRTAAGLSDRGQTAQVVREGGGSLPRGLPPLFGLDLEGTELVAPLPADLPPERAGHAAEAFADRVARLARFLHPLRVNHTFHLVRGPLSGTAHVLVNGIYALAPRLDVAEHAAYGFAWGTREAGAGQLAIAILAHVTGWEPHVLRAWGPTVAEGLIVPRERHANHILSTAAVDALLRDGLEGLPDYHYVDPFQADVPVLEVPRPRYAAWRRRPWRPRVRSFGQHWRLHARDNAPRVHLIHVLSTGELVAALPERDLFILLACWHPSHPSLQSLEQEWAEAMNPRQTPSEVADAVSLSQWFPFTNDLGLWLSAV